MSAVLQDPRTVTGQDRPASVLWRDAFHAQGCDENREVSVLGPEALARIRVAHSAIQTLASVLYDRETMLITSDDAVMSSCTATGLLQALACCVDLAEVITTESKAPWVHNFSGQEGDQVLDFAKSLKKGTAA